jgi:ABC-type dipeptide/oligopeptide/nickel transport system ATPase component
VLLQVKQLKTYFYQNGGPVRAVDGISFEVGEGECFGLVGESGSGKSTVGLSILRLIAPPGQIEAGEIIFEGRDLLRGGEAEMQKIRGAKISMIFQNPFTALNPVYTIGDQIVEAIRFHQKVPKRAAQRRAAEMLSLVQIKNPGQRLRDYPHQFSGGMQQRAMLAMALSCNSKLLIADEPTTALDVTVQAEIIQLLNELKGKLGLSIILITHDFSVAAELCSRIAVMREGKIVEQGALEEVVLRPREAYTQKLIAAVPKIRQSGTVAI